MALAVAEVPQIWLRPWWRSHKSSSGSGEVPQVLLQLWWRSRKSSSGSGGTLTLTLTKLEVPQVLLGLFCRSCKSGSEKLIRYFVDTNDE